MIDMHCHIIPQIDDGSSSITETINMAKRATELGYTGIFATPHYIENSHETNVGDIKNSVEVINKMLKEKKINIELYTGNEVYFSSELLELLKEKRVCTLGNSKYVLFELPFSGTIYNLQMVVEELTHVGYVPILAHPERYEFVVKDYKKLIPLIEAGALLQVNLASITGYYGTTAKKTVAKLYKNKMVHLIGTDSHNSYSVYNDAPKAIKQIQKLMSPERFKFITETNPKLILNDKVVY